MPWYNVAKVVPEEPRMFEITVRQLDRMVKLAFDSLKTGCLTDIPKYSPILTQSDTVSPGPVWGRGLVEDRGVKVAVGGRGLAGSGVLGWGWGVGETGIMVGHMGVWVGVWVRGSYDGGQVTRMGGIRNQGRGS